jgi:FkbM family methyltransferase
MLRNVHYLNMLRSYLGMSDAIKVFARLKLIKKGKLKIKSIKYPFKIRIGSVYDNATFNEVIVKREYSLDLPFSPKTIIDGGANIGLTSLFFINKYPEAQIIAIEPASDNYDILEENTLPYQNIKPMKSAIWSSKADLRVADNGRGPDSYTVCEVSQKDGNTFTGLGIKDIMEEQKWEQIDIVKLDIEGSEKQVFSKDYEYWLPRTKVLIVETHDRFVRGSSKALFNAISRYNFSCMPKGFNMVFFNEDIV